MFAYHGYPWLIHRLAYRRTNHRNLHVRGYKEEGTTTTPPCPGGRTSGRTWIRGDATTLSVPANRHQSATAWAMNSGP